MIKAIETKYGRDRFRSRLEARWAVFFDTLGVRYEYEPEGFDLGKAGGYLPDFWLPELQCWVEIKPYDVWPGDEAWNKAEQLSWLEYPVAIFIGPPGEEQVLLFAFSLSDSSGGQILGESAVLFVCQSDGFFLIESQWAKDCCVDCGVMTASWKKLPGFNRVCKETPDRTRLEQAYIAARQARFEYGEHGGKPVQEDASPCHHTP